MHLYNLRLRDGGLVGNAMGSHSSTHYNKLLGSVVGGATSIWSLFL